MLDNATSLLDNGTTIFKLNVAFIFGSSQQGNTLRAEVGHR